MQEKINRTKLKDLKYEIKGIDSDGPINDCLDAIFLGLYIAFFGFIGILYIISEFL